MKLSAFAAQTLSDAKRLDMNSLDLHRNIKHTSLHPFVPFIKNLLNRDEGV